MSVSASSSLSKGNPIHYEYYQIMAERKICKLKVLQKMKISMQSQGNLNIGEILNDIDELLDLSLKWGYADIAKEKADTAGPLIVQILCPIYGCIVCIKELQMRERNQINIQHLRSNKDLYIQQLSSEMNIYTTDQIDKHISLLMTALSLNNLNELMGACITTNAAETPGAMNMQNIQGMMMMMGQYRQV